MTRGSKSSEKKIIWYAFLIECVIVIYAIERGAELLPLATIFGSINLLPMSYVFGRSYLKSRKGEGDV